MRLAVMGFGESVVRVLGKLGALPVFPVPGDSEGPRSRAGVISRVLVQTIAFGFLIISLKSAFGPILTVPDQPPLRVDGPGDLHLELDEKTRKEIFAQLAAVEQKTRKDAIEHNTWNGHIWSREDDRGWGERVLARTIAQAHKISLTQVYLILDEGIRKKWPGPDGNPLPATVPPLDLRTTW